MNTQYQLGPLGDLHRASTNPLMFFQKPTSYFSHYALLVAVMVM